MGYLTLEALRKHIFNGVIWPDFTRLPSAEKPLLAFEPFAVGFAVLPRDGSGNENGDGDAGTWVFTGDTGPNPAL